MDLHIGIYYKHIDYVYILSYLSEWRGMGRKCNIQFRIRYVFVRCFRYDIEIELEISKGEEEHWMASR
jgi:hypothetical protein